MKTIILINGSGGCGKSTFVNFCKMAHPATAELSTVDYVKQVAYTLGWDGTKTEKNRAFLHDLKMALEVWGDIPNLKVMQAIEEDKANDMFFINVREIKSLKRLYEYYSLKEEANVFSVLVKNSNVSEIKSNDADANVNNFAYDYVIDNSGTLGELLDKAYDFMKGRKI